MVRVSVNGASFYLNPFGGFTTMAYMQDSNLKHTTMHAYRGVFMGKHIPDTLNIGDLNQNTLSEYTISDIHVYTATTTMIVNIAKQR